MKKIIKTVLLALFLSASLNAGENFSEMSTQELIAIMGYVKADEKSLFEKELKSRVPSMGVNEKSKYQKNLQKLK
ncbi:MAG: DUF1104 domain-containing protein [Sulfurimonas sp.]